MNLNSLSGTNWFQNLETQFLSGLQSTAASAQTAASSTADSAGSAANAAATTGASAYLASAVPSNQFAPDVLSALISAQTSPPSSSQVAQGLISSLDGNGDGSLSLNEVASALGGGDSSSPSSGISAAFAKIDTNGDGQLSASELSAALDTAQQAAQSSQGPQGAHGHHHHHHGGGGQSEAANQTDPTAVDTTTTTTTTTQTTDAFGAAA